MSTVVTPSPETRGKLTLIDAMLDEQGDLTAVDRFTQFHEGEKSPLQGGLYSSLLPVRAPGPGQQYAFEVDLDRCSGCKACVAACHSMNGLDEFEAWREVGLIVGAIAGLPVLQHVTSACHHCLDPACLSACPVDAYEKDPVTGIVKHLDDQCFGCQYCTLACPYDVPKFHAKKGIVRKCDMCSDRLEVGEAPACAQACPHEAIKIRVIDREEAVAVAESNSFLATAPAADYTMPTTRYLSSRPAPGPVRAGDYFRNEPEHAHLPLVVMLVLTQASAGGYLFEAVSRAMGGDVTTTLPWLSLVVGLVGIHASLLHLGRPLYAYRALIGLRHSWLSREVAAFGLFANVALGHAAALWFQPRWLGLSAAAAAATGLLAVFCSVMVYHVVRRPFWRGGRCAAKFFGTSIVLGLAGAFATSGGAPRLAIALTIATGLKLALEGAILRHLRDPQMTSLRRTALLLRGPLSRVAALRLGLGLAGGAIVPLVFATVAVPEAAAWVALAAVLGGELAERYLFFAAVVRPKMPGGLAS
ncbi:DmsC/YnfH family molybdoenzyme membrane anchor subunit [Singulisphaera sp. Ch08]|uniref:DmsC/YnfH family molybdoenzyme membrane anchor subunit n=1 Tax=Singulisphaera sp. Ch08 TaxID=3120278 RepID=A0AAU7CQX8_9BACT